MKREEDPVVRYRVLPEEAFLAPITGKGDLIIRTGIYLLLVTGSRAEHLTRIRDIQVTPDGILILWGDRKVRERMSSYLTYHYEWSCRPPKDIANCLPHWIERRERLTHSDSGRYVVAQRINDLIGRIPGLKEAGLTSSFYRRRLSTLLGASLGGRELTELEFEMLMDHRMGTSLARYRLVGNPDELVVRQ